MPKILCLLLFQFILLTNVVFYFAPTTSATSNCNIWTVPESPIENVPPLSESTSENEKVIKFFIQPTDTTTTYKLIFPGTISSEGLPGWNGAAIDNLATGGMGSILLNSDGSTPSLKYKPGEILSKPGETHTFYLERKGASGHYCDGTYIIKKDQSGGIESCKLDFSTLAPDEKSIINITGGNIKPANGDYQLSITGTAKKDLKLNVDSNGIVFPITIGRLNPGNYTATLQKKGIEYLGGDSISYLFKDTNCKYSLDIAAVGSQGSFSQIGKPGPAGDTTTVPQDKCKDKDNEECSKAGGEPCDNNTGFKTAIGCIHTNPAALVKDFLTFAIGIGGGVAFMMMLLGAFQMMTSGGNPQNLQGGRDVFQNAIIGLLFIIFSILLMKIIGIDILSIPGFK